MLNFPIEVKKKSAFSQNWITLNAKKANGIFFSGTEEVFFINVAKVYWMRCCKENLSTFDVVNHGGSWKRLYIEKYIENMIEKFRPMHSDMFDIKDLLPTLEPFIKRLEITELLPPNVQVVSFRIVFPIFRLQHITWYALCFPNT